MHSHNGNHEPSPESLERRHEQEDLSARSIVSFLAILIACTGGVALLMVALLHWFGNEALSSDDPPSPLASAVQMPPEPRLQALPSVDLKKMREHDREMINGYGWVSREANVARVPVSKAMELLAKRGLPVWPIVPLTTEPPAEGAAPAATATPAPTAAPSTAATPAPETQPAPAATESNAPQPTEAEATPPVQEPTAVPAAP